MLLPKTIGLSTQILISLALGIMFGYLYPHYSHFLKPIGDAFLRMIKMIVVPLIISSLIAGIAGTTNFKHLGRLGFKTLLWFQVATMLALIIGMLAVNILQPGTGITIETVNVNSVRTTAQHSIDIVQMVIEIIPSNIIDAMSRGNMLQIVFFSTFFAIAATAAGKHGQPIIALATSVTEVMLILTRYVMKLAPLGIFSTIAVTVGKFGLDLLIPLSKLIVTLYIALFIFIIFFLLVAMLLARVNFFQLMYSIKEPLLLAFTTASSETALPMLIERLQKFGIPQYIVTFVLPTGYSFNLAGATLYTAIAVIFIAQVYGISLDWGQQILLFLTLMVTTKGMAAVPGGAMIAILGTVTALGLPIEGMALILGVDRILDMGRTITNVMGNAVATIIIARWEHELPATLSKESYAKVIN